jgi:hypothetical protein
MTLLMYMETDEAKSWSGQYFNIGETFAGIPFGKGVELADKVKSHIPEGFSLSQMALR